MQADSPVAVFSASADVVEGAECIQRRIPVDYPSLTRLNQIGGDATVTAYIRLHPNSLIGQEAYQWQVRLTPKATELRTNTGISGEQFADAAVYDAIRDCGFKRKTPITRRPHSSPVYS
ncbi:MAG: hypothetical protein AAF942_00030 [Pseudomonadota bacterium]